MAERTIGLRLELNGFRGVITNIKQLEEELRKAKEDLSELEIGGSNFTILSKEIQNAESKLMDLRKATEGIGIEKKLEGFGKFAAGITGGFAAAQSAVMLFGNESDAVGKAAIQIQNLLTVAMAARSVEELRLGAAIVAKTVADKASAAAAATSNKALKALFTTIAANPIGALVTAVGLLVAAMVTLNDTTEETTDQQKELGKTISDEAVKLNTYANILKNVNSSNEQRLFAIEELKKSYPGFNAFLDDENRLTKQGILFIDLKTKALNAQAKAQYISQQLAKLEVEALTIQNKSIDEQLSYYDRIESFFVRAVGGAQASFWKDVENATNKTTEALKDNTEQQDVLKQALNDISQESGDYAKELARLEAIMKKQADADAAAAAAKNKTIKTTKEEIQLNQELLKTLTDIEKVRAQLLVQDVALGEANAEIIKSLEEQTGAAKGYADKLNDLKNVQQLFAEAQAKLLAKTDNVGDAFVTIRNAGENLYDSLINNKNAITEFNDKWSKVKELTPEQELEKSAEYLQLTTMGTEAYTKALENLNEVSKQVKAENVFNEEQLLQITKYEIAYKQFTDAVKKFSSIPINPPFDAASFEKDLIDVQLLLGKIQIDPFGRTQEQLQQDVLDAQERLQKDGERFIAAYVKNRQTESEEFNKYVQDSESTSEKTRETAKKYVEELTKIYRDAGKEAFENLKSAGNSVIVFENGLVKVREQANKLNEELKNLSEEAREGFILTNKQALTEQFIVDLPMVKDNQAKLLDLTKEVQSKTYDVQKNYQEDVNKLQEQLLAQGVDITKFSYATKLELLKEFLTKEVSEVEKAEKEKQDKIKNTLDNINLAIQTISKSLTDISSIVAQSFQIQLDRLNYNYKDAMSEIVGDTEEANQKRIETEKSYQAEKAQIERKAQLASLRFTLAQTIASGAQSIVSAAALPPPANFIVGALNAGITAAQVAIIQTQINDIQSRPLRRGGLLSMGGFIDGPSHEQGGVYAGGGYTLEGNESVINRQSTLQYSGLLSQINQSGGGRPIVVQSPMDSRLVEALAKQKTEPIRAYVVEQDITKAQSINRRLEQLASF